MMLPGLFEKRNLYSFWIQCRTLTVANLKSRYRNSFWGIIWVIMNPILLFGAQAYAFHYILKVPTGQYPLFLLCGLLPWIFMISSLDQSVGCFINNGKFFHSFPVSPMALLLATIIESFVNFLISFVVLLIFLACIGYSFSGMIFIYPILILNLGLFVLGYGWLSATLQVYYKDFRYILSFVMTLMFYVTPIVYPASMVPAEYSWIYRFNPFYYLLTPFQNLRPENNFTADLPGIGISLLISIAMCVLAIYIWRKNKDDIAFHL
jgi:ABC-type polysaccharide/polyol phosphate export permease